MRVEKKYLLPEFYLDTLRSMLAPFTIADPHTGEGNDYTVRSIYYDTQHFSHYYAKVNTLPERRKVRIRTYNTPAPDDTIFLELKKKSRGLGLKNRGKIPFTHLPALLETGNTDILPESFRNERNISDLSNFFYNIKRYHLRPVVLVTYDREPYQEILSSKNNVRITFDKKLRSKEFPSLDEFADEQVLLPSLSGYFVMEVKYNYACPAWLAGILRTLNLQARSVSKYVISIDDRRILTRYGTVAAFRRSQAQLHSTISPLPEENVSRFHNY